jgi:hypothetical protein
MKHTSYIPRIRGMALATMIALSPMAGHAACYAEYKAKRDNPLKLHYGVAELSDSACNKRSAAAALAPRLASDGWILLSIVGFVDASDLGEVKANAGNYFLRY